MKLVAEMTANAGLKQGGRFQKGTSGNPLGKPTGATNHATRMAQMLLDGQIKALTDKAIEMALAGDTVELRLWLERIVPPRKDRPVEFPLPKLETTEDAAKAISAHLHPKAPRALLVTTTPQRARREGLAARGAVSSRRKTTRAVIRRTIIDGTTHMRESPDVFHGKLRRV